MRLPSFLPAVLVMLGFSLIAGSAIVAIGAPIGGDSHVIETRHSDDNVTFVAATFGLAQPGREVRTPGLSHWPEISFVMDGQEVNAHHVVQTHAPAVLVLPGGTAMGLVDGSHDELLRFEGMVPLTFTAPDAPGDGPWGPDDIDIVWLYRNETADYDQRAAALLAVGIEGRGPTEPNFVAVAEGSVPLGRGLRAVGVVAIIGAVVTAMWPRRADGLVELDDGLAGASIALVEAGAGVLARLRNAYMALATLVIALGLPVVMALGLWAGTLSTPDIFGSAREQPWDGWQAAVWYQLLAALVAAVIVAARPAIDAHTSLRVWNALASDPPIEGEF